VFSPLHAKETLENRSTRSTQHDKISNRQTKHDGNSTNTQKDALGVGKASKQGGWATSDTSHLGGQDSEDREGENKVQKTGNDPLP
jgi:hypothetical protein